MKRSLLAAGVGAALWWGGDAAVAGPLQPARVAGDARWLAHLDVERALTTTVGEHLGRTLIDRKLAAPLAKVKQDLDIELDWRKVRSISAYGWELRRGQDPAGVLLIESSLDLPGALDIVIDRFAAAVQAGDIPIQKSEFAGHVVYAVKQEWVAAGRPDGLFAVARSRPDLERALLVLGGSAPSLAKTDAIRLAPRTATTFFEAGVSGGVLAGAADVKAARLLGNVTGGWLSAGEDAGRVLARVGLQARDAEMAGRVQHLVQGVAALGVMMATEQPDLLDLARSAEVSLGGREVQLGVSLPTGRVLAQLSAVTQEGQARGPGGPKRKGKSKARAEAKTSDTATTSAP